VDTFSGEASDGCPMSTLSVTRTLEHVYDPGFQGEFSFKKFTHETLVDNPWNGEAALAELRNLKFERALL
jgi:hypothetical protein